MMVFAFPLAMVYAAVCDAVRYEVPNWLSAAIVLVFIAIAPFGGMDLETVGWHLSTGVAVLLAGCGLFAAGIMGGGDAKLLAAASTWVGWSGFTEFVFVVALAGGILALIVVALRHMPFSSRWTGKGWIRRLCDPEQGIPYCVAIGFAGIWVFPNLPVVAYWLPGLADAARP